MLTLGSEAVHAVALDPAFPVGIGGADNKADSSDVVDVAVVMIEDVTMVDCTDTSSGAVPLNL